LCHADLQPTDRERGTPSALIVYAVVDDALSPDFPLGVELDVFIRREDAQRSMEGVLSDHPRAAKLRSRSASSRRAD
jgi:hypothetical protein